MTRKPRKLRLRHKPEPPRIVEKPSEQPQKENQGVNPDYGFVNTEPVFESVDMSPNDELTVVAFGTEAGQPTRFMQATDVLSLRPIYIRVTEELAMHTPMTRTLYFETTMASLTDDIRQGLGLMTENSRYDRLGQYTVPLLFEGCVYLVERVDIVDDLHVDDAVETTPEQSNNPVTFVCRDTYVDEGPTLEERWNDRDTDTS